MRTHTQSTRTVYTHSLSHTHTHSKACIVSSPADTYMTLDHNLLQQWPYYFLMNELRTSLDSTDVRRAGGCELAAAAVAPCEPYRNKPTPSILLL